MAFLQNIELVTWTPHSKAQPPLVTIVRGALLAEGFKPSLAELVPVTTAFRRNANDVAGKDSQGNEYKVTIWENGRLRAQLDKLVPNENTHRISREFIGSWSLADEEGTVEGTENDGFTTDTVKARMRTYTWADVTKIVQEILKSDGLGAYSIRANGGVYIVPTTGRFLLDRLSRMGDLIGLSVLRYEIPDTAGQRDMIASSIAARLTADLDEHVAAMNDYDTKIATIKLGHVENRQEALCTTRKLAESLGMHMGDRLDGVIDAIKAAQARCDLIHAAVKAHKPTVTSARRVVNTITPSMLPSS